MLKIFRYLFNHDEETVEETSDDDAPTFAEQMKAHDEAIEAVRTKTREIEASCGAELSGPRLVAVGE